MHSDQAAATRQTPTRRGFLAAGMAATAAGWVWNAAGVSADQADTQRTDRPAEGSESFHPDPAIAAYSFRKQFAWMRGKPQQPQGRPIDMRGFIDYCSQQGGVAAELTAYFFPPDIDRQELLQLKRYAFLKGVTICGTAVGNHFDSPDAQLVQRELQEVMQWIDRAAILGAPHIRLFAGTAKGLSDPQAFQRSVDATRRCADHAADSGVIIGVENHGGITPETLLRFLDAVDHPWVGINLDTGNFSSADPYADLQQCVHRAVHVQWKVNMRDGSGKVEADFQRLAAILRSANYNGFVALEYEEQDDPYRATAEALQRMRQALQAA